MAEYDKHQGSAKTQPCSQQEGETFEEGTLYFAYGSNMDLGQMNYRCPEASVIENARLDGYRLAFRGRDHMGGVATILPDEGSHVDGVLWKIDAKCEE